MLNGMFFFFSNVSKVGGENNSFSSSWSVTEEYKSQISNDMKIAVFLSDFLEP